MPVVHDVTAVISFESLLVIRAKFRVVSCMLGLSNLAQAGGVTTNFQFQWSRRSQPGNLVNVAER